MFLKCTFQFLFFFCFFLTSTVSKPWAPIPPCAAPIGVDQPAVLESMCSHVLGMQVGDIVLREYGLPINATLVSAHVDGSDFSEVLNVGVQQLLQYFSDNTILNARTTPITVRDLRDNNLTYIVSMMVSTATFPDNTTIPQPNLPVMLETIGLRSIAALQFNTTDPPVALDFEKACGRLLSSSLPKGYKFDLVSSWSPSYVFYSSVFA
jgi:hypothetical protein